MYVCSCLCPWITSVHMCTCVCMWPYDCIHMCVCVHILMGVFWGCCNKLPQTWWLKTTQIYSLTVLEARVLKFGLKSRYRQGFPGDSVIKNLPANAGGVGLIPGLGRSPGEGNDNPMQCSYLGNLMDRGAWWAVVHGVPKSWTQLRD